MNECAPIPEGCEKQRALQVADVYAPVLIVIEKLGAELMQRIKQRETQS